MIKFNVNEDVYVKLTPYGITRAIDHNILTPADDDGYTIMSLWEFMKVFGEVTGMLYNNKYYDLTIKINPKSLQLCQEEDGITFNTD